MTKDAPGIAAATLHARSAFRARRLAAKIQAKNRPSRGSAAYLDVVAVERHRIGVRDLFQGGRVGVG
jgi:hypothetical protein